MIGCTPQGIQNHPLSATLLVNTALSLKVLPTRLEVPSPHRPFRIALHTGREIGDLRAGDSLKHRPFHTRRKKPGRDIQATPRTGRAPTPPYIAFTLTPCGVRVKRATALLAVLLPTPPSDCTRKPVLLRTRLSADAPRPRTSFNESRAAWRRGGAAYGRHLQALSS